MWAEDAEIVRKNLPFAKIIKFNEIGHGTHQAIGTHHGGSQWHRWKD